MFESASQNAMRLIDSHAHLDTPQFEADRDEVVRRTVQSGVIQVINVGTDLASSQKSIDMAQLYPAILAAVGIHPQESINISEKDIAVMSTLSQQPKVIAIGEIGLDFHREYAPREQQIKVLKWQLALADERQLPVIIHCRQAEKEMVTILTDWLAGHGHTSKASGVIHCFNSSLELAEIYLHLGFYISLGAYVGYPSSMDLREVVKQLPLDRLLIETDCPFLPPQSRRGQRNEPAYVVETAKAVAEIRGLNLEEVAVSTSANTSRLFRLDSTGSR